MRRGDISNLPAASILIDARLIVEKKRKPGLAGLFKNELVPAPGVLSTMYYFLRSGVSVTFVISPGTNFSRPEMDRCLDSFGIPFSEIILNDNDGIKTAENLRMPWVHAFFYKEDVPKPTYISSAKYIKIHNILDTLNAWG